MEKKKETIKIENVEGPMKKVLEIIGGKVVSPGAAFHARYYLPPGVEFLDTAAPSFVQQKLFKWCSVKGENALTMLTIWPTEDTKRFSIVLPYKTEDGCKPIAEFQDEKIRLILECLDSMPETHEKLVSDFIREGYEAKGGIDYDDLINLFTKPIKPTK